MRPFQYLRDPLWLACVALYFLNRLVARPMLPRSFAGGFFHEHLNDLICLPFWLPPMLWAMRRLGARTHDEAPQILEVAVPLILWSWLFEVWLPQAPAFGRLAFSDPSDVLAYSAGAVGAFWFWRRSSRAVPGSAPGAQD